MNRLILFPEELLSENRVLLCGRRAAHIRSVLDVKVGDELRFGILNGKLGMATLVEDNSAGIKLELNFTSEPPAAFIPCTLILALPRPKVARRIVQMVCALGVRELHLINSYRVDKSYWGSHYISEIQIQEQLILGLEQSGSTLLPKVHLHRLFRPFVEDRLPLIGLDKQMILAHPYAEQSCPVGLNSPSVLIVGPEGGFTAFEVELLQSQGVVPVTLGKRILRVETAVPALIGRLYTLG